MTTFIEAGYNEGDSVTCPVCNGTGWHEGTGERRGTSSGCNCCSMGTSRLFLDLRRGLLAVSPYDFAWKKRDRDQEIAKLLTDPPAYRAQNKDLIVYVRIGGKRVRAHLRGTARQHLDLPASVRKRHTFDLIKRGGYHYFEAALAINEGKPIPKRFRKSLKKRS